MTHSPTERQLKVLRFIHTSATQSGRPPTLREIAAHMGITSTNGVNDHLRALERKGLIRRDMMLSRAIVVTQEGLTALGLPAGLVVSMCPECGCIIRRPTEAA